VGVVNILLGALEAVFPLIMRFPRVDRRARGAFAALDVAGYNYMYSRYRSDARRYPERVILGTETAPTETVRIWREIDDLPSVIGDFVWAGWDYIGEAGVAVREYGQPTRLHHPFPALLAGEPVIDITGRRQTQSYLNEIAWRRQRGPFIAVQPVNHSGEKQSRTHWRSTNSIRSWSWEGCEGRPAVVEVYADAHRVELLLDGARVGERRMRRRDEFLATFTVPYRPGRLAAVAYDAEGRVVGTDEVSSATRVLQLAVASDRAELIADGADLAHLEIALTDDVQTVRPLADRTVEVSVRGDAALLGLGSGNPITPESFSSPRHRTYNGRALAVIRAGAAPGACDVTVSAEGCTPVDLRIPVVSVPQDPHGAASTPKSRWP
jgi:hypothetical protein